jgi:hypothetical protein
MRIGLKADVANKLRDKLKEIEEMGFRSEQRIDLLSIDITTMGGEKEILVQPELHLTFFFDDKFLEEKK